MSVWTPRVTKELLLSKCNHFVGVQLWPTETKLDARGWLSNFTNDEEPCALHLLNSFFYFSEPLVERLFVAGILNLSQRVLTSKRSFIPAASEWRDFLSSAYFVRVTGERPSDTDSGYIFARMARQELAIPESHIVRHEEILEVLLSDPAVPVIFVDDFVGSGRQFITMWRRKYSLANDRLLSFEDLTRSIPTSTFFYCPIVCTSVGLKRIYSKCPGVVVSPVHTIDQRYSALSSDSILWPETLRLGAHDFILGASERAGIPDTNGNENDWRGFDKLALTIAFAHSVPDATLPIFYWEQNGWKPLVRRK